MVETHYKPPGLEPWDIVIVLLYFIVILGVGLYVSTSNNRSIQYNRLSAIMRSAE